MSEDLIEATKKAVKKVADFLEIEEVGTTHHSKPYNPPKGEASQLLGNVPVSPLSSEEEDRQWKIRYESILRQSYFEERFKPVKGRGSLGEYPR